MAEINQLTGYYGFTVDGLGSEQIDAYGRVNQCIVALVFPNRVNDVDFTISDGPEDWAVRVGDGTIIPVSNPRVLYVNRNNAIVAFTMSQWYPANSPCFLVYRSNTATFKIKEVSEVRPFEVNTVSGYFAFTRNTANSEPDEDGQVDHLIATIPYPHQISDVHVTITNEPNHWGAHMGNGKIINLSNPIVLRSGPDSCEVDFTMAERYPSNSPCVLVYLSSHAKVKVEQIDYDTNKYPVEDIINVPNQLLAGRTYDLSSCEIVPHNASIQGVDWSIIEGNGYVNAGILTGLTSGQLTIRATVDRALEDDSPFHKTFNINIVPNILRITAQPTEYIYAYRTFIDQVISVTGVSSIGNDLTYQWYRGEANSHAAGNAIPGATSCDYAIPKSITNGDYYYYCKISSPGAQSIDSDICHLHVSTKPTAITIVPKFDRIDVTQTISLRIQQTPADAELPEVKWTSSKPDIISIDNDGTLHANLVDDEVIITARSVYGDLVDSFVTAVIKYIPVEDIQLNMDTIRPNFNYDLNGVVVPNNATHQVIQWSVVDPWNTGVTIQNGVLRANTEGACTIRATIKQGNTFYEEYSKQFLIKVKKGFAPVEDIVMDLPTMNYFVGESIELNCNVVPIDATNRNVTFTVFDTSPSIYSLVGDMLTFKGAGTIHVRATVIHGTSRTTDYTKEFDFVATVSSFIPVRSVYFDPDTFDPIAAAGTPVVLNPVVLPTNASNKDVRLELIDPSVANINYNSVSKSVTCDPAGITYELGDSVSAIFRATVKDGIKRGEDFVSEIRLNIAIPEPPEEFVSLEDYQLNLPSPMRVGIPIKLNLGTLVPDNASKYSTEWKELRDNPNDAICQIFTGGESGISPDSNILRSFVDIDDPEILYLFPWSPGHFKFKLTIKDAVNTSGDKYKPVTEDFEKTFEVDFQDPYIQVTDVTFPSMTLYANEPKTICPVLGTNGGLNFMDAYWDDDVPTNRNIKFRMGSEYVDQTQYPNTANASMVDDHTFVATQPGKFTVQMYIEDGAKEPVQWYDYTNDGYPVIGLVTFTVKDAVTKFANPICTLKLKDGTTVQARTGNDMTNLATSYGPDSNVYVDGHMFKKSDVTEITFWDQTKGGFKLNTLMNFARNFTSLVKIDRIPSVDGNYCLAGFLQGCTSFNQDLEIPAGVTGKYCLQNFLKDCTSFNSDVVFAGTEVTGEGCLYGFMEGCSSFNKPISIPSGVTGAKAMKRFLRGCIAFNQEIELPAGLQGGECLRECMEGCSSFNHPITIPNDVGAESSPNALVAFMFKCDAMNSPITVPLASATANFNVQTFATMDAESIIYTDGLTFVGTGGAAFAEALGNIYFVPYRKIKK